MPKGLQHKRELAKRRKGGGGVQQLKSKTARKKGGEIFTIKGKPSKWKPIKKRSRGPGRGKLERDLDRVKKEIDRKKDDDKLRRQLRGAVGEIVAQIQKPGEIVSFVRNAEGGLDRRVRTRADA